MSRKHRTEADYDVSAERLLTVLTDPEFLATREKAQGAVDASADVVRRQGGELVVRVDATEHGRTMTGGVDRSKRQSSRTTHTWDLSSLHDHWVYEGSQGDKVRVEGSFDIQRTGDESSRLVSEFSVDVSIPLIGSKIEKIVIDEIKKAEPRSADILERFLRR